MKFCCALLYLNLVAKMVQGLTLYNNSGWMSLGNNLSALLLLQGELPQYIYESTADTSFFSNTTTINSYGLVDLASIMINSVNGSATNLTKRDTGSSGMDKVFQLLGLDINAGLVTQLATMGVGASGSTTATVFSNSTQLSKRDTQYCSSGIQIVWDYVKTAGRNTYKKFTWQNMEWAWGGFERINEQQSYILASASTIASWVKGSSTKSECKGFTYVLKDNNYPNDYWIVGGAPWTTGNNCDTTASLNTITEALEESWKDVINRKMVGNCARLHNGGTWYTDVRVLTAETAADCGLNLWNYQCDNYVN
ncbi:hypothetical protein OGAPHI_002659 [Ogataea philodendri]|uniref:Secreted protein CSS2 C-terminal domain-containing protein n=1 Tax=Ogataea philodendri TaxID=1378263 RepID=A0A9P8PCE6_9ASCO|nr:uncharacterized protein OGAPHI_002659 [Ogataea philodendri]KAH3668904.1 hypothetical protein OGAPHI_002659 [Ogataea philodendri]